MFSLKLRRKKPYSAGRPFYLRDQLLDYELNNGGRVKFDFTSKWCHMSCLSGKNGLEVLVISRRHRRFKLVG